MSQEINCTMTAWMSPYNDTPSDPTRFLYVRDDLDMSTEGYTYVGTARMVVTLSDPSEIVAKQIAAYRQQIEITRSEAQRKIDHIESKIQSLQAITYQPAEDGAA